MSEKPLSDFESGLFLRAGLSLLSLVPEIRNVLESGQHVNQIKIEFSAEKPESEHVALFPCRAVE